MSRESLPDTRILGASMDKAKRVVSTWVAPFMPASPMDPYRFAPGRTPLLLSMPMWARTFPMPWRGG